MVNRPCSSVLAKYGLPTARPQLSMYAWKPHCMTKIRRPLLRLTNCFIGAPAMCLWYIAASLRSFNLRHAPVVEQFALVDPVQIDHHLAKLARRSDLERLQDAPALPVRNAPAIEWVRHDRKVVAFWSRHVAF